MRHIKFNNKNYPFFQSLGNASQFAIPFAKHYCKGLGVDIGFGREEWKFPGAIGVEVSGDNNFDAYNIPDELDYIYSSHCLEHLHDWVKAIEIWCSKLKKTGCLFLYLPHPDQEYWLPWNNRKHKHVLHPQDVVNCIKNFGMSHVFCSNMDLNHSYCVIAYNDGNN